MNSLSVALRSGYLNVRTAEGASAKQSSLKARLRNGLTYLLTCVVVHNTPWHYRAGDSDREMLVYLSIYSHLCASVTKQCILALAYGADALRLVR